MRGVARVALLMAMIAGSIFLGEIKAAPRLSGAPLSAPSPPEIATTSRSDLSPVIRVIDGDTIVALYEGATTTIRLIGLDTPETVDPRKPVECFGPEASAEAHALLDGKSVQLIVDPSQSTHDIYGRTLAYAYLPDGTLYDEFMIAHGFAHEYTYKKPYEFESEFKAAQTEAKKELLGLWSPATCNGNTGVSSREPSR